MYKYDPTDWYWVVAGAPEAHAREDIISSATKVFSSKISAYVPSDDPAYLAWVADANVATAIDTEENLNEVLVGHGISTTGRFRLALGQDLYRALTSDQVKAANSGAPKDVGRLQSRGSDMIPETNASLGRLAKAAGTTAQALFDLALAPS